MHTGNHALANIHSHHLTESPAAYPSPNRSMYCRKDALASVGQVHAVLWGQGGKMSTKKAFKTQLSPLLPICLLQDWEIAGARYSPGQNALSLYKGLHIEKDTLEAKDFPSPKYP